MKKLLLNLIFFMKLFSLNFEEKETISKYLDFEKFEELIILTDVLGEKKLNEINLKELNEILQKKWFKGSLNERWEIKEEELKNSEKIIGLIKDFYKKDGTIDFVFNNKKELEILENKNLENPEVIIIFGGTFLSILNRTLCAFSIAKNRKNFNKKIEIIFLTGYRKIDERVDFSNEKRTEILKDFFPNIKNVQLLALQSFFEEDLMFQIKSLFFENLLDNSDNFEVEVFSEKEIVNGKRATTESTLRKLLNERDFSNKKIIGISSYEEFINYQQSVVDLSLKKIGFDNKINIFGFKKDVLNIFSDSYLLEGRKRSLSEKLDTIARIIFNCLGIYQHKK